MGVAPIEGWKHVVIQSTNNLFSSLEKCISDPTRPVLILYDKLLQLDHF